MGYIHIGLWRRSAKVEDNIDTEAPPCPLCSTGFRVLKIDNNYTSYCRTCANERAKNRRKGIKMQDLDKDKRRETRKEQTKNKPCASCEVNPRLPNYSYCRECKNAKAIISRNKHILENNR